MEIIKQTPPPRKALEKPLKKRLQRILENKNLDNQRVLIKTLSVELGVDILDLASALIYISQDKGAASPDLPETAEERTRQNRDVKFARVMPIKMVRYRLEVGIKHGITMETLKKTLIDESGVDKNNINNVDMKDFYTLIELPDEMPQDIFQHLKSVELNQQKLDIKRIKNRNHFKRGNHRSGRGRQRKQKPAKEKADFRYNKLP